MQSLLPFYIDHFLVFVLVLARTGALVFAAPVFGSRSVPMHVRGLLAGCLAMLMTPLQWHAAIVPPHDWLHLGGCVAVEAMIGLSLGLAVTLLFASLELAGRLMSQASGLSMADVAGGENGQSTPIHGQLLYLVGLAVFVGIGGHRLLMAALLDTFQTLPPGGGRLPATISENLTLLLSESFSLGLRAAAPVLTAVLIATIVVGLAGRAVPQLDSLRLSLVINTFVMLVMLLLSLAAIAYLFAGQIEPFLETWRMQL